MPTLSRASGRESRAGGARGRPGGPVVEGDHLAARIHALDLALHVGGPCDPAGAARLIVDALVNYGVSGAGVFDVRTGGLIGVVEGISTARVVAQGLTPPWYIDVPVPGQTHVTPLADIRRFLGEVEQGGLLPP
jgi:hypothetical protein